MACAFEIEPIAIRPAREDDRAELLRLAERDSAPLPSGRLLVAEVGGSIRAAVALDGSAAIADPFHFTAELVSLLRAHARGPLPTWRRPLWMIARTPDRTWSAAGRGSPAAAA